MKQIVIGVIVLVLIGVGAFLFFSDRAVAPTDDVAVDVNPIPTEPDNGIGDGAEPLPEQLTEEVIGQSVDGTDITAYHYSDGEKEVLLVGGIHSGFAPNTVAVADELKNAFANGSIAIPAEVMVTVIPNLNPDAERSPNTVAGRLNSNDVDLNRNFDCEWSAEGTWQSTPVSGGSAAFSEPETAAIRDYVAGKNIAGAVVYYAADGGVYASNCGGGLSPDIATLTGEYAEAAGYTANDEFDAYRISGDMTNWLAKNNVPAISVLLSDYTNSEFEKNRAGVVATLNYFAN